MNKIVYSIDELAEAYMMDMETWDLERNKYLARDMAKISLTILPRNDPNWVQPYIVIMRDETAYMDFVLDWCANVEERLASVLKKCAHFTSLREQRRRHRRR